MVRYRYTDRGPVKIVDSKIFGHKSQVAAAHIKAHAKFGAIVANPKTYYDVYKSNKRGEGFVLPGSRYIGPGKTIPEQITEAKDRPKSAADAYAYAHDKSYSRLEEAGHKPWDIYTGFHESDQKLIDQSRKTMTNPHSLVTYYGMHGKKLLNKTGLTKSFSDPV